MKLYVEQVKNIGKLVTNIYTMYRTYLCKLKKKDQITGFNGSGPAQATLFLLLCCTDV